MARSWTCGWGCGQRTDDLLDAMRLISVRRRLLAAICIGTVSYWVRERSGATASQRQRYARRCLRTGMVIRAGDDSEWHRAHHCHPSFRAK